MPSCGISSRRGWPNSALDPGARSVADSHVPVLLHLPASEVVKLAHVVEEHIVLAVPAGHG